MVPLWLKNRNQRVHKGTYTWSNTSVEEKGAYLRGLYAGGGGAYRRRNTVSNKSYQYHLRK